MDNKKPAAKKKKPPFDFTLYKFAEAQVKSMRERGDRPVEIIAPAVVVFLLVVIFWDPQALGAALTPVIITMPVWLPIYLVKIFFITWVDFVRFKFWFSRDMVLLEVTLPPEVEKSPMSMEVFLANFANTSGENTGFDRIFSGKFRATWSLEIACNEGRIAYYMHIPRVWRNSTEARLYGQFPEARVEEVEDYVSKIPFSIEDYDLYGLEYAKGDPQALPIKTYIAYELDKDKADPENQTDPLTHILELMSTAGKDEYMWLQFIVRGRKHDEWRGLYNSWAVPKDIYGDSVKGEVKAKFQDAFARSKELEERESLDYAPIPQITESEKRRVENIERALTKPVLECGIRAMYVGKREVFKGINIPAIIGMLGGPFRGIQTTEYNGFIPASRGLIDFNFPWQDFRNFRQNGEKRRIWDLYKYREYFFIPYNQIPVFLTTEELATIWRFPSSVVRTPGLQRVPSRSAQAPANLPV